MSDALTAELKRIVLARLEHGSVSLPTTPEVAARAADALRAGEPSTRAIVGVVERDPLLAAQLLRATASGTGGTAVPSSLDRAVGAIGAAKARSLVLELAGRRMYRSSDTRIQKLSDDCWRQATSVAALSRDIAAVMGADGDAAYLAGLLTDLASAVVAAFLLDLERLSVSRGARFVSASTWSVTHRTVSQAVAPVIAARWELPDDVRSAMTSPLDYEPSERHSAANFARFASALARKHGVGASGSDPEQTEALMMIGRSLLGVDDEVIQRLGDDLAAHGRSSIMASRA